MKAVCGQGRTNYGGLRNVRPPIIDPHRKNNSRGVYGWVALLKREGELTEQRMNISIQISH